MDGTLFGCTRQTLKEVKLLLDNEGFSEAHLRAAYRDVTNQDIAVSIIGFVRQQVLRTPLEAYEDRFSRALRTILGSRRWTQPQRQWLNGIGKQLIQETVVDRETLDSGEFSTHGGYARLNKVFDGRIDQILADLHEQVWKESA